MGRKRKGRPGQQAGRTEFKRKRLAWWSRAARDLPWRRTRDPYRVLVSEFMLQQTQVSRVAEYYPRFIERFPDLETLARAKPRAVREQWDGLGYYARASNLHALARVVSKDLDGTLPDRPEELIKLPGIGPYTAGAVATFAYEKPVPAVDTNVARVLHRVFIGGNPAPRPAHRAPCSLGASGRIGAQERPPSLEVQSGDHGAGSAGVRGEKTHVPGVPCSTRLQNGESALALHS